VDNPDTKDTQRNESIAQHGRREGPARRRGQRWNEGDVSLEEDDAGVREETS